MHVRKRPGSSSSIAGIYMRVCTNRFSTETMTECSICGAELIHSDEDPVQALVCMHSFHLFCVGELVKHVGFAFNCPECRFAQPPSLVAELKDKAQALEDATGEAAPVVEASAVVAPVVDGSEEPAAVVEAPGEPASVEAPGEPAAVDDAMRMAIAHLADEDDTDTEMAHYEDAHDKGSDGETIDGDLAGDIDDDEPLTALKGKGKDKGKGTPKGKAKGKAKLKAKPKRVKVTLEPTAAAEPAPVVPPPAKAAPIAPPEPQHVGGAPTFPSDTVMCHDCGSDVQPSRCRLVSKMKGTFRCVTCRVKITELYRDLGNWPPKSLSNASLEQRREFMRSIHGLNKAAAAEKGRAFLKNFETKEKRYANGGMFLPLEKWAHDGFDSVAIELHTLEEDIQHHPILGKCYRVKILMKEESGTQGTTQGDELAFTSKLAEFMEKMSANAAASSSTGERTAAPLTLRDLDNSDDSDSDSSSSSSSCKKDKKNKKEKKKKDKKKKKQKKEKAKEAKRKDEEMKLKRREADAEKATKLQIKQVLKESGPVTKRMKKTIDDFEPLVNSAKFFKLPVSLQAEYSAQLAGLRSLAAEFEPCIVSGTVPPNLQVGAKRADEAVKSASILKALYARI